MAHSLTWKVLGPEETQKCLAAPDVPSIRSVLKAFDESCDGQFIGASNYNEGQVMILLDMLAHLVLFCKSHCMSAEKVSTLVGIASKLHKESMSGGYTRAQSYHRMQDLMIQHSVPRPPFSCGVFTVRDAQAIDEYMLQSYYRHYKMYVYAFVPRQVANVRCLDVSHIHQIPPVGLPSLVTAIGDNEWRSKVEEQRRGAEAQTIEEEEVASDAYEQERLRQRLLTDPHYSDGIREQLESIKKDVTSKAVDRLDEIEARLLEIEKKVMEATAPDTKEGKRKK
ncbi:flagellar associated protein [Trypanosoma conorhini]|uniref:Flagellar associated protein n=1 Tax=Trypanosoma conorhini TaxID=83891 RepID=A0A422PHQ4_9TRYP|nr:flagellar associated protein [Trypanosoma conorhini]RNF17249.1 flagellar associated protein [Trypanosoma conorhini]